MSTIKSQLADYRELDAPLKRSMRRWWKGTGRLWLVAIGACGFLSIASIFLVRQLITGNSSLTMFFLSVGAFASYCLPALTLVACFHTMASRCRQLRQLSDEAALPESAAIWQSWLVGSLASCWPLLAAQTLTILLRDSFLQMFINTQLSRKADLLRIITGGLDEGLLLVFMALLAGTWLHTGRRSRLDYLFLACLCAASIASAIGVLFWRIGQLGGGGYFEDLDPVNLATGSILAIAVPAWVLLSRKSGPRPQFTMSVFATIRLLELFAMFTAGSASIIWARLLMLEEILTGWQAVFTRMPFGYGEHTFHYFDHSEGGTALFLFWQSGLAVRTGPIGYMLALLLNLAWLAIVFLFCRWAVGRSAVREE